MANVFNASFLPKGIVYSSSNLARLCLLFDASVTGMHRDLLEGLLRPRMRSTSSFASESLGLNGVSRQQHEL